MTSAIVFFSSKEDGYPLHLVYADANNTLNVCRALWAMGADYIRAYDNPNCQGAERSMTYTRADSTL